MAKRRAPRILFFTQDAKPTEAELSYADDLGANVGFRHGRIAASATKPEVCDGVAAIKGALIPMIYAQKEVPRVKNITEVNRLKPAFGRGEVGYPDDEPADETQVQTLGNETGEPSPGGPIGSGDNGGPLPPDDDEDEEPETEAEKAARLAALAAGDGSANRPQRRRKAATAAGQGAAAALLGQPPAGAAPAPDAAPAAPAAPAATAPEPAAAPAWAPPPATPPAT